MLQTVDQVDGSSCVEEWITEHQERLDIAFKLATEKTENEKEQEMMLRQKFTTLSVGMKVFLRNRVQGRNKIQDVWDSTPYTVVRRLDTSNTYVVESLDGQGIQNTIYRKEIVNASHLSDGAEFQNQLETTDGTQKEEEQPNGTSDASDSEDDENSPDFPPTVTDTQNSPQKSQVTKRIDPDISKKDESATRKFDFNHIYSQQRLTKDLSALQRLVTMIFLLLQTSPPNAR